MNISLNGYKENAVTFLASGNLEKGMLVKMKSNNTVAPCAANDSFIGVCVDVRGDYATVVTEGYVKLPAAKTINVGYQIIAASSNNKVTTGTAGTTGREYLVIDSDSTSVGFIL